MNIITVPYGSKGFYIRPDTSLNRDSNDYFCPDEVTELAATVFIYARATKAGKCVSAKFAPRYYTSIGTGIHLSAPQIIVPNAPETWWTANSLDNSTFLAGDEEQICNCSAEAIEKINAAFETASHKVSFRTGDYITVETGLPTIITKETNTFTHNGKVINIIW